MYKLFCSPDRLLKPGAIRDVISTPVAGATSLLLFLLIWRFIPDPLQNSEKDEK